MNTRIDRSGLTDGFWETKPLSRMSRTEWEALCDGCGKCCLNKLEDAETGEVVLTRIACRLFDDESCGCTRYQTRHDFVPECIVLTPDTLQQHMYWLPQTCAYRLLHEGRPLFPWHPLISGNPASVFEAGISVRRMTRSEAEVPDDEWEDHLIEEPM